MKTIHCRHVPGAFCPDCDYTFNRIRNALEELEKFQNTILPDGDITSHKSFTYFTDLADQLETSIGLLKFESNEYEN